jgi:acetoin utilization deacetylase AcuC-like enzyme
MWHEAGYTQCVGRGLQPTPHFESAESKRRLHNLLDVTGTLDTLARVRARAASRAELARVHSEAYIDYIVGLSEDTSKGCHHAGDCLSISPGGFDIAARAAGAAIRLVDTVLGQEEGPGAASGGAGEPSAAAAAAAGGAYGLVRPPGHHASRDAGMG